MVTDIRDHNSRKINPQGYQIKPLVAKQAYILKPHHFMIFYHSLNAWYIFFFALYIIDNISKKWILSYFIYVIFLLFFIVLRVYFKRSSKMSEKEVVKMRRLITKTFYWKGILHFQSLSFSRRNEILFWRKINYCHVYSKRYQLRFFIRQKLHY